MFRESTRKLHFDKDFTMTLFWSFDLSVRAQWAGLPSSLPDKSIRLLALARCVCVCVFPWFWRNTLCVLVWLIRAVINLQRRSASLKREQAHQVAFTLPSANQTAASEAVDTPPSGCCRVNKASKNQLLLSGKLPFHPSCSRKQPTKRASKLAS